jgi:hypothetical protein
MFSLRVQGFLKLVRSGQAHYIASHKGQEINVWVSRTGVGKAESLPMAVASVAVIWVAKRLSMQAC